MKFALAKNRLISASMVVLGLALVMSPVVHADTFPYLKVFGGDSWAGGWFNDTTGACNATSSPYQNPSTGTGLPANDRGGIVTFANNGGGGATDEFGAMALGAIDNGGANQGFFTDQGHAAASKKLSFANAGSGSTQDGGTFEGGFPHGHCIPDYFTSKQNSPTTVANIDLSTAAVGQYLINGDVTLNSSAATIGNQLTVFVKGNVYINGNIQYAAGYTEANVPKFALVVQGNIFIDPSVSQMDGVYIAEPTSGTTDGVIWTCHDGSATAFDGPTVLSRCGTKLLVNGSLIAKQVNFERTPGDVGGAPANETSASNGSAEVINYTPAMVIGGPFFNPPPPKTLAIHDLVNLPPLF